MSTPLLMLALMTGPYAVVRLLRALGWRRLSPEGAAAVGLALLFVLTASGHFTQTEAMSLMLPGWVPAREPLIHATGLLELAIAAGFLVPGLRRPTGYVAAFVLVAFFPANVYAAIHHAPMGGHAWGPVYLLVRAPLQLAILAWVYRFAIRPVGGAGRAGASRRAHAWRPSAPRSRGG